MRKNLTLTTGIVLAILIGTWTYASIPAGTTTIAHAVPAGIDVMQLTLEAGRLPTQQFAAF